MPERDTGYYDVQAKFGFPDRLEALLMGAMANAGEVFPNSIRAISAISQAAYERWRAHASGKLPLPDGRTIRAWTGTYFESIRIEPADTPPGVFAHYVIGSDDPKAHWLEYGTDAWDMKKMLQTSHQVRQTAEGKRYLIIPFRWGTPETLVVGAFAGREMPAPVYSWWLQRDPRPLISEVTGTYTEPSIIDPDFDATRYTYNWGDRLTPADLEDLGIDPDSAPGKHMAGMVRMRNFPDEPSRGFATQYLTFRTMTEDSPGWQHPGMEGYEVAKSVYDWVMQASDDILRSAMDADVTALEQRAIDAANE